MPNAPEKPSLADRAAASTNENPLKGRRVAVLATDGVEQVELVQPMEALKAAGADKDLARAIFAADIAWVAASVLVLMLPAAWTGVGIAGIAVVALIVADIAILEYLGLRRLSAAH